MSQWEMGRDSKASTRAGKALRASVTLVTALAFVLTLSLMAVGCGDSTSGPEAAMQKFFTALGSQDIDTLIDLTYSPEALAALEERGLSKEDIKYGPEVEMLRSIGSLEFSDVTMETAEEGDEAVVTITGGSVTMPGMGVTIDLTATENTALPFPTEYYLYRVDGKWYIDLEEYQG